MVDARSGRRLQMIAADRAMHERPDMPTIDACRRNRLFGTDDALIARQHAGGPETALVNAGHELEPALGQAKPLVKRLQPPFKLGRSDDFVGQRVAERFETNVAILHRVGVPFPEEDAEFKDGPSRSTAHQDQPSGWLARRKAVQVFYL